MNTTTPAGAGEKPPQEWIDAANAAAERVYASCETRPAPDLSGLEERLTQAADDIFSGATIFSDRVHGLLIEAADALKAAGEERDAIKAGLSDPNFVHINMLGGGIAKPSLRQMLHLEGEAALATWDKATSLQQENDRLREALTEIEHAESKEIARGIARAALSPQGGDAG